MSRRETVDDYGSIGGQGLSGVSNKEGKKRGCSCGRYEGIMYTMLAGISLAVWGSLAKYLKDLSPTEISFYTFALAGSFTLPLVVHKQWTRPNVTRRIVFFWILFSLFQTIGGIFRAWSFQLLPLGDASSIVFSTPVFTAIFARIILKDHITWMTIISLFLSVIGMLLTMKLPDLIITGGITRQLTSEGHLIGCIFAVVAVIATAGLYLVLRSLRGVPVYFNSFVQLCFTVIIHCLTLPTLGGFHQPSCSLVTSICVIATGVCAFFYNFLANQALKTEDPTTVGTVVRTTEIFLAFLIQLVLFRDQLNVYNISGAIVILFSGFLMPLQRWMEGKPLGSAWKESWLIK